MGNRDHVSHGLVRWGLAGAGALVTLGMATHAAAQAATTPGAITTPNPTLENVSIEWAITGDDDADGQVTVRFREQGAATWRAGLPLFRVPAGSNEGFDWNNRHAGSLFGLVPGTTYEVELTLTDPDGGNDQQTVNVQTRSVPEVPADAQIVDVTPATLSSALNAAQPGDVLLLGSGTYGDIVVPNDGTAASPIVVRGADTADTIVEGEVRMDGRSDVWIEQLVVRGQIKFNDATRVVVRDCWVEAATATGDGIVSYGNGSTDGYFADNVVTGTTVWAETSLGVDGDNLGEGIVMTGPGNVIEHNRVSGFRDCISVLEDDGVVDQYSIDILNNDLDTCADDAIEADFSQGNVRVMRNQMANSFVGLSSQPSLGGPTYFIRNVLFSTIFNPFKLNRGSVGDVALHNTVVKCGDALGVYAGVTWSHAFFRNNLFIGGVGGDSFNGFSNGSGRVLHVPDADEATCTFDYDGFGSIGTGTFQGRVGSSTFSSLAEMQTNTTEAHAVEVDLSVFAASFAFPEVPFPALTIPDLRLAAGSAAVDTGTVLPNINDDFSGTAPDLGAYEFDATGPTYGPRDETATGGTGGAGGGGGAPPVGVGGSGIGGDSAAGAGGVPGVGGAAGAVASDGGAAGTAASAGGAAQAGSSAGGAPSTAGTSGDVGVAGSAGSESAAGGSESAAGGTEGVAGAAGTPVSPGAGGNAGSQGTGGTSPADGGTTSAGGAAGEPPSNDTSSGDDGGCGCRVAGSRGTHGGALALLFALLTLRRRRR
jgi:MYXO-CTERM domain-containing protein